MRLLLTLTTAALATARLTKRCTPVYDDAYQGGFLPAVACWHEQDTACNAYLQSGTEMLLDAPHHLAVVYGVSDSCADTIKEELAREADGRKTYGWTEEHGTLTLVDGGILVISGMSDKAVEMYEGLEYLEDQ